jgi:hypothetical protein
MVKMASAGVDINGIPYDDAILNEGNGPTSLLSSACPTAES